MSDKLKINFVQMAMLLMQLLPVVRGFVEQVEGMLPAGSGQQKLALVRQFLSDAFDTAQTIGTTFDDVWPAVEKIIASIVRFYNARGIFSKPAAANTAAAPVVSAFDPS